MLFSQDADDLLFAVPGLLDYRLTLMQNQVDRLDVEYMAGRDRHSIKQEIGRLLLQIPAIKDNLAERGLTVGTIRRVDGFGVSHTVKRTILDLRNTTHQGEPCSIS